MNLLSKKSKFCLIITLVLIINSLPLVNVFASDFAMTMIAHYNAPQCSDGIDNDGDGLIDYPADPGCSSPDDDDETDVPPIQPEQPTIPSQGNYNPPTQLPPEEQELPVWITINSVNNQYLTDLTIPYQFTDRILTFKGQTNANDAVIFIQLNDNPNITFTTNVFNEDGYFQWTTPYVLALGDYTLEVLALNPADPTITATVSVYFQIVEQILPPTPLPPPEEEIPPAPEIILPPPTEIIPPLPGVVIPPAYPKPKPGVIVPGPKGEMDFYSLNIKVLNKNKSLYPKDKLRTEIEAHYFGGKEIQTINLKLIVLDENQQIIMETEQLVALIDKIIFNKNFLTSFTIKPGRYTILVEFTKDGKTIQSSDSFYVLPPPLLKPYLWGGWTLEYGPDFIILTIILSGLFILFLLILYKEKRKTEEEKKITIEELVQNNYLDIE